MILQVILRDIRKEICMVINIIMVVIALIFIGLAILAWCICSVNPPDPRDDEEQILYINDWNKKQGMR